MNENELILCDLLNCKRVDLALDNLSPASLSGDKKSLFLSIKEKREQGQPLQYILGRCEFFGLEFKVRPGVFIPRPETEILVEKTIEKARPACRQGRDAGRGTQEIKILDIGTGSGNIAISLAKNIPQAKITAIDISQDAIELARENAKLHGVLDRIEFIKENIFLDSQYAIRNTLYDLIVSNPPYIKTADIENLQLEVQHEPRLALDGGKDGLNFYRGIIDLSSKFLNQNGILLFEIGFGQLKDISKIVKDFGDFEFGEITKDYNQIERVVILRKNNFKQRGQNG